MITLLSISPAFAFVARIADSASNIVFIGIAMALGTIFVIADTLLDMLATNLLLRMFVATVAGVSTVIITHVTGDTFHIVIAIKLKVSGVIEGGRGPLFLAVALAAVAGDLLVQTIFG